MKLGHKSTKTSMHSQDVNIVFFYMKWNKCFFVVFAGSQLVDGGAHLHYIQASPQVSWCGRMSS